MPSCFSFLSRSQRDAPAEQIASPAARVSSSPSSIPAAHHPSCGYCGNWETISPQSQQPILPSYDTSTAFSSDQLQQLTSTIHEEIQTTLRDPLRTLSLDIHSNPEVGFEEHKTHDILVKFMKQHEKDGWKVTPHAFDLDTAWSAVFVNNPETKSEKDIPLVGFNSEEDALPGIGHACGHVSCIDGNVTEIKPLTLTIILLSFHRTSLQSEE